MKPPNAAQLRYLRGLAEATSADASREIDRLKALPADSRGDRRRERRQVQADLAQRPDDATRVRPGETSGYVASQRPLGERPPEGPAMSAQAGRRVELQRYRISAGERALIAQRVDGRVAVVDVPLDHDDRVYLVERHVSSQAELNGICSAYAEHSRTADRPAIVAQRELLDDLAALAP